MAKTSNMRQTADGLKSKIPKYARYSMKNRSLVMLVPGVLTLALSLLLGVALSQGWFGPASASRRYFCEYVSAGLLREPANTVSNLGFILAGLVPAWRLWSESFEKNDNPLTRNAWVAVLFCSLPILLGFGSAAMHATETELGGDLDLLSMYLMAGFALAYAVRNYFGWGWGGFAVVFAAAVLFCEIAGLDHRALPVIDYAGDAAFGCLIVLIVVFETLNSMRPGARRDNAWGVYALISFLAAFAVWN
ncbi:MAG: ceramidase domain-containing protein, partial [bacterium]